MKPFALNSPALGCDRDRAPIARRSAGFRIRASDGGHRPRAAGRLARSRRAPAAHLSGRRPRSILNDPRGAANGGRRPGLQHTPRVSRCESGCKASRASCRPVAPWSTTFTSQARAIEATESISFIGAYSQAFQETLSGIDDLDAYELTDWFVAPIEPLQRNPPARPRRATQKRLPSRSRKRSISYGHGSRSSLSQFRGRRTTAARRRHGEALRHRRDRDPVSQRRDDRCSFGPPAAADRRRRAADAASSSRSIDRAGTLARPQPTATRACSRSRGSRATRRFAHAHRSSPTATTRARHRLDRQTVVERRPGRHAGRRVTAASSPGRRRSDCRPR